MLTVDKLRAFGADVDDGLKRCMNNEAFYLRLVNMALDDPGVAHLQEAAEASDRKAAFEAAHALKGMLANLSLALPRRRSGSSPCATANKPHSLSRRNLPPRGRR